MYWVTLVGGCSNAWQVLVKNWESCLNWNSLHNPEDIKAQTKVLYLFWMTVNVLIPVINLVEWHLQNVCESYLFAFYLNWILYLCIFEGLFIFSLPVLQVSLLLTKQGYGLVNWVFQFRDCQENLLLSLCLFFWNLHRFTLPEGLTKCQQIFLASKINVKTDQLTMILIFLKNVCCFVSYLNKLKPIPRILFSQSLSLCEPN